MILRGIEALIANTLHQKFNGQGTHDILDQMCGHVHMSLQDLEQRNTEQANIRVIK